LSLAELPSVVVGTSNDTEQPLLRGKYRVIRVLGEGGMGTVLEALHVDLERKVALKLLKPELRSNAEIIERFLREGRAASKIEGANVARVLDVDRLDDGTPFLIMEYLDGHDLSLIRRSKEPLPVKEALEFMRQACIGIAEAHVLGIIHRDIKPANLFYTKTRDGEPLIKVLDFGISKLSSQLADGSDASTTRTTLVMGSAEYMSPEQMLSTKNVDARSDVWALGVTMFELLTATSPFAGDSVTQVCAQVMSLAPPKPSEVRKEVPLSVERVVLRCLEKDKANRYATVRDLQRAIESCIHEAPEADSDGARSIVKTPRIMEMSQSPKTTLLPDTGRNSLPSPAAASVAALQTSPSGALKGTTISNRHDPASDAGIGPGPGSVVLPRNRSGVVAAVGIGALSLVAVFVFIAFRLSSSGTSTPASGNPTVTNATAMNASPLTPVTPPAPNASGEPEVLPSPVSAAPVVTTAVSAKPIASATPKAQAPIASAKVNAGTKSTASVRNQPTAKPTGPKHGID
jgi:eukaryotic-like serine/threonine-protein kinase